MNEQFVVNTDVEQSLRQLKLQFYPPKRYVLSKTIPIYQKDSQMTFFQQRLRKKSQTPQYFTNILRQQKKNMFVNTFLRKLKSTIVMNHPPQHKLLQQSTTSAEQDDIELQIPKFAEIILLFIWLIHAFSLLLLNSMALIFKEFDHSKGFYNFMILSLFLHSFEIGSKFLVHLNYQQNKLTKINEITIRYLKGQFWLDAVVLFGLFMYFIFKNNEEACFVFRLMIFGKMHSLIYIIEHLEITLIENEYREQIWSLIKVFMFNFVFAHILTLFLVSMARINEEDNWLVSRGLVEAEWSEKYIWGYYWATTIMLTVGFGDIIPRNSSQALCMIFIETMSCIVLAYNINRVGTIIQKIRSYQAAKNSHLKTFNHIKQKSEFSNQTKSRIMNYIKESTEIKRNFNLGEQKEFIESLPQSFKSDMLKEMNKHIWNGMMFFQNLSEETLIKLSITIEKKLAHPEEIVYSRGNDLEILVFNGGGFGYSFNNGNSANNGRIMQHFDVSSNQYQIATLDFLFKNKLKYDIKCTDYSVVYKLSTDQLIKILNNHSYDSEYFFMIKDKDKFLLNEFELAECQLCKKQRHSVFKCPKLHFLPLREHVIRKYKDKYYPKIFKIGANRTGMKRYSTLINQKQNKKNIQSTLQFVNNYMASMKSDQKIQSEEIQSYPDFKSIIDNQVEIDNSFLGGEIKRQTSALSLRNIRTTKFYEQAIDEIRSKIDNMIYPTKFQWDLQLDLAFNYKFYFRKYNSDEIANFTVKRSKIRLQSYNGIKKSFGYRKKNKL